MAVKNYRPTSAGRRFVKTPTFEEVTKTEPEKKLVGFKKEKCRKKFIWQNNSSSPWWRKPSKV